MKDWYRYCFGLSAILFLAKASGAARDITAVYTVSENRSARQEWPTKLRDNQVRRLESRVGAVQAKRIVSDFGSAKPAKQSKFQLEVSSSGETIRYAKLENGKPTWIEILDGQLCSEKVVTGQMDGYSIQRRYDYGFMGAINDANFPWVSGHFDPAKHFRKDGASADLVWERKPEKYPIRQEISLGQDGRPSTMRLRLGSDMRLFTTSRASDWRKVGDKYLAGRIEVVGEVTPLGKGHDTWVLTLESARPESNDSLRTLGERGQVMDDCRFGNDRCVQYKIGDHALSDDEVLALLGKKKPERASKPAPDTTGNWLLAGGAASGAALVLALLLGKRSSAK